MSGIDRRTFIKGLGGSIVLAPGVSLLARNSSAAAAVAAAGGAVNADLTKINPAFMVTPAQVTDWHKIKDSKGGPTIAGSPSWKNYLELLEKELKEAGVVDTFRNPWTYTRWETAEWPDESKWGVTVDGEKIKVASYGANSGKTPDEGVTGELVVYEDGMAPEALKGKIVVLVKDPAKSRWDGGSGEPTRTPEPTTGPDGKPHLESGDFEYLSAPETFPDPVRPRWDPINLSPFQQMGLGGAQRDLIAGGALGVLEVLGLSYEGLAGTYTFGVPAIHEMPTLYIDFETGRKLVEMAAAKKKATMRLISKTEESETYQFFGYLPGKNYKTDADEQVLLVTHTDGPSISQENGGLGILSMVKYFSKIPQAERPRTILVFLDCRHYMPGAERAFAAQDYATSHPEVYAKVIAAMGIEHLGQIDVEETKDKPSHKTDLVELSTVWTTNNQALIDLAIKAIETNKLPRVQVQTPGRPGKYGGTQGPWYGLGGIANRRGIPGVSTMGSMTAYWSSKARMDYLDANHFVKQMATMSQICGELMTANIETIKTVAAAGGRGGAGRGAARGAGRGARRGGASTEAAEDSNT